tara:strand:+ start:1123 stop:1782 length:660 start_codon:yes stop_codon:yes gene_type:complete
MKICFLTKKDKPGVRDAIRFLESLAENIDIFYDQDHKNFPKSILKKKYDLLISYISPWIISKRVLERTTKWNINFHPGPPEYPGIGCFNFAIFDSSETFGSTAHIMLPKVDSGNIIGVKRFAMTNNETVESLSLKTYKAQLSLFKKVISYIFSNDCLPKSDEIWKRKAFKRTELEKLCEIKFSMNTQEVEKRIRATYFPGKPAPYIKFLGHKFELNPNR